MTLNTKRQITIEWDDTRPGLAIAASRSGLEYMQAIMAGEAPPPPIAILMNMRMEEVRDGYARFSGIPGEQHFNPIGMVHGGYASTLLDSALGCAVHTTLAQGIAYSTAQLNVNLTRSIMADTGKLIAEAHVIHRGRRMMTADATLKGEADGKLYAHGTTTCFVFEMGG